MKRKQANINSHLRDEVSKSVQRDKVDILELPVIIEHVKVNSSKCNTLSLCRSLLCRQDRKVCTSTLKFNAVHLYMYLVESKPYKRIIERSLNDIKLQTWDLKRTRSSPQACL